MTVLDYILSTDWCYRLKLTNSDGKYLLLASVTQVSEPHKWLDKNLKALFVEYIPQYGLFNPVESYAHPKYGNKPQYSRQLGIYADKLHMLYSSTQATDKGHNNKRNYSPLHKYCHTTQCTMIFDTNEYPALTKSNPKCTQSGEPKPQPSTSIPTPTTSIMAKEI